MTFLLKGVAVVRAAQEHELDAQPAALRHDVPLSDSRDVSNDVSCGVSSLGGAPGGFAHGHALVSL